MKKQMFRMLCVVLALALLAPNVFAATPPPEAPLADEATVTRVKNEIATGEITDMEDVFLVAYQHLGADLEEEGMTAYINEDGTLGFTQIISTTNSNARSGSSGVIEYAASTLAIVDENGVVVNSNIYNPSADTVYGGVNGTDIAIVHTTYYSGRIVPGHIETEEADDDWQIRVNYMVTNISGASPTHYVTKLVQNYAYMEDGQAYESDSKTTSGSIYGTYYFTPASRSWYSVPSYHYDAIVTGSTIYVYGISAPVSLVIEVSLNTHIPN